ncbi:MAG TPA: mechanosensitive ion channel protein [Xenococcaceae cyanobacterium]
MLILTKDQVEYYEVAALINGQQKKSSGFIYRNNVFIKVKHYSVEEYEEAIKDCRENFLDNEEKQIPTLMLKEPDSIGIWIQDNRYKPLSKSPKPAKTHATTTNTENNSTLKLQDLVARMRGKDGLKIKTRRHKLKLYQRCFLGNEATDWLVENLKLTRPKAIKLGQKLIDKKIIHHVTDDHVFKDEPLFYRFYGDEDKSIWTDELL